MIHLKYLSAIVAGTLLLNCAAIAKAETLPTIPFQQGSYRGQAPDWSKITWEMLPPLQQAGYIKIPAEYVSLFGYDPSRSWNAGQKSDSVVMLGDVDDEFLFGDFSLDKIAKIVPINEPTLQDVGFMQWQTTASLVKAIPSLGKLRISQVKPISKLLSKSSCRRTIARCLDSHPKWGEIPLGEIDLSKYSTESIPGLQETLIWKFKEWQQTYINQVPGLNKVPFSQMPNPIGGSGTSVVGLASVVLGESETGDPKVGDDYYISGSVVKGDYTVPKACEAWKECSYLELGDFVNNGSLYGKRWASGSSQQVKGGYGFLAGVNGGKEPTGRLVYSRGFKVAMTGVDESKGTADFGLFFRICVKPPFLQKTCTPYFIGPIPWIPVQENDLVIVGVGK